MRITVRLEVDVDLNAWTTEYGTAGAGESLTQVLNDLHQPGWYFQQPKWQDLASVNGIRASIDLNRQPPIPVK